jgi:hypothetical protein
MPIIIVSPFQRKQMKIVLLALALLASGCVTAGHGSIHATTGIQASENGEPAYRGNVTFSYNF